MPNTCLGISLLVGGETASTQLSVALFPVSVPSSELDTVSRSFHSCRSLAV